MKNIQSVSLAGPLLASMTREELRSVAKVLNVPRGRSGKNTRYNLSQAIANGQAHIKIMGYIYAPASKDSPPGSRGVTLAFIKKLSTYKAIEHNYGFMP
jgi:hypothetical protein